MVKVCHNGLNREGIARINLDDRILRTKKWRRGSGSNRRIKVLQTSPLPLGYRALAGLPFILGTFQSAVANPADAGGQIGAGDEI